MAYADGNIVIGTSVDMYGMNTGLYKIQRSIRRLQTLLGLGVFAKLGKSAIDAASDLQEVQNIVDVSFGKMAYKIENFSQTSISQFGMSELAAKQTAGSYAAMGKAIGFDLDKATDMAVELTGLTGDFASFNNISQDYARVGLSAVYTGETETLKRYGIILTEANLQEFAARKGITEKVHAMSALEKTELRYQYILETTSHIQGDFVRTQNSWANQTRILQQVWNKFLVELGQGLIGVLIPVVRTLNLIVMALTRFIAVVKNALFSILGIRLEDTVTKAGDVADNLEKSEEAAEGLGNGIKKAGKEARKSLAPFDEINRLMDNRKADGGGGGAGFSIPDVEITEKGGLVDKLEEEVADEEWTWFKLGSYIGSKIAMGLANIQWNEVFNRFESFGVELASFLNGLFTPYTFKQVGITIANSLNSAVRSAFKFSSNLDWTNLGESISAAVNNFFLTFDFAKFAETLNIWIQGLTEALRTAFDGLDKQAISGALSEFFDNLDFETITTIIKFKLLKSLYHMLPAILISLSSKIKGLILSLLSKLGTLIKSLLSKLWATVWPAIKAAFPIIDKITAVFNLIKAKIIGAAPLLGKISTIVGGVVTAILNFVHMLKNGFDWLHEILMVVGVALTTIGAILAGVAAWPAVIVGAIVAAVGTLIVVIKDKWEVIKNWFIKAGNWISDNFNKLKEEVKKLIDSVVDWFITKFNIVKNWFSEKYQQLTVWLESVKQKFKSAISSISESISNGWNNVKDWWNSRVAPIFTLSWWRDKFSSIGEGLKAAIVSGINAAISALNTFTSWINSVLSFSIPPLRIGNKTLFSGFQASVNIPKIPALAKGAVIPPNAPFVAQLGDQKHGTNLEAPESLIRQIFREESGSELLRQILYAIQEASEKDIVLDGNKIGKFVSKYQRDRLRAGG